MLVEIRPIKTEEDYQAALKEVEALLDAPVGTPEGNRLEVLVTLVEVYEVAHYEMPLPEPVEAILYCLEARGLSRQDLAPWLGGAEFAAAVLERRMGLTLEMIRDVNQHLGIPAEILIQPYDLVD